MGRQSPSPAHHIQGYVLLILQTFLSAARRTIALPNCWARTLQDTLGHLLQHISSPSGAYSLSDRHYRAAASPSTPADAVVPASAVPISLIHDWNLWLLSLSISAWPCPCIPSSFLQTSDLASEEEKVSFTIYLRFLLYRSWLSDRCSKAVRLYNKTDWHRVIIFLLLLSLVPSQSSLQSL